MIGGSLTGGGRHDTPIGALVVPGRSTVVVASTHGCCVQLARPRACVAAPTVSGGPRTEEGGHDGGRKKIRKTPSPAAGAAGVIIMMFKFNALSFTDTTPRTRATHTHAHTALTAC